MRCIVAVNFISKLITPLNGARFSQFRPKTCSKFKTNKFVRCVNKFKADTIIEKKKKLFVITYRNAGTQMFGKIKLNV